MEGLRIQEEEEAKEKEIYENTEILYQYVCTPQDSIDNFHADVILVPGNAFTSSADFAAKLYKEGKASFIIMSGGAERNKAWLSPDDKRRKQEEMQLHVPELNREAQSLDVRTSQNIPANYDWLLDLPPNESDVFAWKATDAGVPDTVVIREPIASNTPENYHFSLKVLEHLTKERGLPFPTKVIIVTYIEEARRNYLTAHQELSPRQIEFRIVSPRRNFEEEYRKDPRKKTLNLMASIIRMFAYGKCGKKDIAGGDTFPTQVVQAMKRLEELGVHPRNDARFTQLLRDCQQYTGTSGNADALPKEPRYADQATG